MEKRANMNESGIIKTSKRQTELVTCSCPACMGLPMENRQTGHKDEFLQVKYPGFGIRYLWPGHVKVEKYSTKNEEHSHKAAVHGIKVGLELEGTFPDDAHYGAAMCGIYGFVPTSDSSILAFCGEIAVELKTPIYRNLCGIQSMLRSLERALFTTVDNNTGHHVNISSDEYVMIDWLVASKYILDFGEYLLHNPDVCEACFGREMNDYTVIDRDFGLSVHRSFIHIHDNRVEFRLPKYHNARQYFLTINLCIDLYKTICKFAGTTKADQLPKKLIRICEKFVKGERTYQKRQTDKYADGAKTVYDL